MIEFDWVIARATFDADLMEWKQSDIYVQGSEKFMTSRQW